VSANAACSGTWKRATPASLVVTVAPAEFVPSPLAFQSARPKAVSAGSPPMLYSSICAEVVFRSRPVESRPSTVSWPVSPA
jgi:sorbitol-specific phosphotransferase system component IIBC